jgi:hypothetical protein
VRDPILFSASGRAALRTLPTELVQATIERERILGGACPNCLSPLPYTTSRSLEERIGAFLWICPSCPWRRHQTEETFQRLRSSPGIHGIEFRACDPVVLKPGSRIEAVLSAALFVALVLTIAVVAFAGALGL